MHLDHIDISLALLGYTMWMSWRFTITYAIPINPQVPNHHSQNHPFSVCRSLQEIKDPFLRIDEKLASKMNTTRWLDLPPNFPSKLTEEEHMGRGFLSVANHARRRSVSMRRCLIRITLYPPLPYELRV
jgi:hypothetical protein